MSADTIARLKISLDDAKPAVLRRVEVPFDIRLDRLHLTIQAAMGWTNSHLYEIRAGNVGWSTPDPDADGPATSSTPARLGSATFSKTSAQRRWRTSMTSATVGSIRSRSSISPIPSQACSTRA
jgi:hypothetical protein